MAIYRYGARGVTRVLTSIHYSAETTEMREKANAGESAAREHMQLQRTIGIACCTHLQSVKLYLHPCGSAFRSLRSIDYPCALMLYRAIDLFWSSGTVSR